MPGPLHGVTVLEFCQVISGPLAGMLLAQQGADVIKVESPGIGDPTRQSGNRRAGVGAMFANVNRAKRSVVLDARHPAGHAVILDLVRRSDVLTQNWRPGKAAKLGLGPEQLLAVNPSLIYVSISGFGATGPMSDQKVYDYVIQGAVGFADAQRDRHTGRPSLVRNYVVDKATSWAAAQAVSAALFARERDPQRAGQHLEISMLDTGVEFFWPEGMMDHTFQETEGTEVFPTNLDFYDAYETSDGAVTLYPIIPSSFAGLCVACGHPEWVTDERFAEVFDRRRNMAEFATMVADALRSMTTASAIQRLVDQDVAVGEVVRAEDVHAHPQVRWNDAVVEHVDPLLGRMRVPRHAPRFSSTPAAEPGFVPAHGAHTEEVLAELGLSEAEIGRLIDQRVAFVAS